MEPRADADVRRLVLSSGKIYWELAALRRELDARDVALVRLEQFYPIPEVQIRADLERYAQTELVWAQEEPRNMGAFNFVEERLRGCLGPDRTLRYVGLPRSSSTATGSLKRHLAEQEAVLREAIVVEAPAAIPAPVSSSRRSS